MLFRYAALKSQPSQLTFYAGNAVQNGKGVLIRLPSQKSNYKMGNENNKIAEGKNGYEERILDF